MGLYVCVFGKICVFLPVAMRHRCRAAGRECRPMADMKTEPQGGAKEANSELKAAQKALRRQNLLPAWRQTTPAAEMQTLPEGECD